MISAGSHSGFGFVPEVRGPCSTQQKSGDYGLARNLESAVDFSIGDLLLAPAEGLTALDQVAGLIPALDRADRPGG